MNDLASYRLNAAHERLAAAKDNIDDGHYKDSINRSYYAMFTAIRALLAERDLISQSTRLSSATFKENL